MVLKPNNRHLFTHCISSLKAGGNSLQFVSKFKFRGHCILHNLFDDDDIQREICSMFVRFNILIHEFDKCSREVKKYYSNCFAYVFMI